MEKKVYNNVVPETEKKINSGHTLNSSRKKERIQVGSREGDIQTEQDADDSSGSAGNEDLYLNRSSGEYLTQEHHSKLKTSLHV
jgi:hypothetical protein